MIQLKEKQPPPQGDRRTGRRLFKKRDILLVALVIAIAVVLWVVFSHGALPGGVAVVNIGLGEAQEVRRLDLAEDRVVDIDAEYPVHLEIKDGAIRFIDSVCPNHDCEAFGWLRQEGDWAACLPAGVNVRMEQTAP